MIAAVTATPSPSTRSRRPDGRRELTMERLRVATLDLASDIGIDAMTIDDVALRAGVAKGTVYYNVRDKDELICLAFVDGLANLAATIDRETAGLGLTPQSRFEALVRTLVGAVTARPGPARLLVAEAWRTGRPWYADLVAGRQAIEARIGEIIRDLPAASSGRPDSGLLASALLVTTICTTLDQVTAGRTGDADIARQTATLIRLFRPLRA